MEQFAGVFESLACDETEVRTASRKALVLSQTRINERLGKWLGQAKSPASFEAVYSYVQDDFEGIIRVACEECGHEDPEGIANTLKAHFRNAADEDFEKDEDDESEDSEDKKSFPFNKDDDEDDEKTSSVHEARRPKMCPYHSEVVDISLASGEPQAGYNSMAQHAWGGNHCQGEGYAGGKCNFKRDMVSQSFWDNRQKDLDAKRELRQEQMGEVPLLPEDTIDEQLAPDTMSEMPEVEDTSAPEQFEIDTAPVSDLAMSMASNVTSMKPIQEQRDEQIPDRVSASPKGREYNPSNQTDESGKSVPCPQCGGDGKTSSGTKCSRCEGKGDVSNWGPSTLDALNSKTAVDIGYNPDHYHICQNCGAEMVDPDGMTPCPNCGTSMHQHEGLEAPMRTEWEPEQVSPHMAADGDNTGLGGPEPKMNKEKWTPKNVSEIDVPSKYNPTKRKDPIEPIKAVNDDELKEIGEQTTETQDLPAGSEETGGGFAKGGEDKAPGSKTFPKGKHEVDPVTKSTESSLLANGGGRQSAGPSFPPEGEAPGVTPPARPYNPAAQEEMVDSLHPAAQYAYQRAVQQGAHPQEALQTAQGMQQQMIERAQQGQNIEGIQLPVVGLTAGFVDPVTVKRVVAALEQ